jgi:methyl-accepting chemotaxis protein
VRVLSYNEPVFWNGVFIGVIGIEINYRTLAQEVENIRPYKNGYAFVLDEKGDFIYHPQMNSNYLTGNALPPPPKELLGADNGIRYTYNGIEKEAVWMPLSNGMRLYVCAPVSEINSSWQKPIWDIIYASVIVLLIVGVIIMFLANRITKPLQDLSKAAREVYKGNYDFALEYDKNDEIGGIARSFRKLVAKVKEQSRKKGGYE